MKKKIIFISIIVLFFLIFVISSIFMFQYFNSSEYKLGKINEEIKKQMSWPYSGEILVWDQLQLDVEIGKSKEVYFGIKNTDHEDLCYYFQILCMHSIKNISYLDGISEKCDDSIVAGVGLKDDNFRWAKLFSSSVVNSQQLGVFNSIFQISTATPDTYEMKIKIFKSDESECDPTYVPNDDQIYAQENFIIVLKE